jgi:hypothetical protein
MTKETIESLIKRGREAQEFADVRILIGGIIDELCDALERLSRCHRSTSEAKQTAARTNGLKGGRKKFEGTGKLIRRP